jgi:hypothetical protein
MGVSFHSRYLSLNGAGHNEDGWTNARLVRVLSESTGVRKLAASVVCWNVLAVTT